MTSATLETATITTPQQNHPGPVADSELLRRFLSRRDEVAFAAIVSRFGALVLSVAWRMLRDRYAAEDVFQATFLVLARDGGRIRNVESLTAWIHGTALRLSRKALLRKQREALLLDDQFPKQEKPILDRLQQQFEQQVLDEELQQLPEKYRGAIVLHFLEGKSVEETSLLLGVSSGSVRGRLQRGKQLLRCRLIKRVVELSVIAVAFSAWQTITEAGVSSAAHSAAVEGGLSVTHGIPFTSSCSAEAVHLAARETIMFTSGQIFVGSAVLVATASFGWFAHAASTAVTPLPVDPLPVVAISSLADADEMAAQETFELAVADDPKEKQDPATVEKEKAKAVLTLKYDDGKPDGKKSLAGTGEIIEFTLPDKTQKLRSLRIHCARYGTPQAPDEDAEISIVSADGTEVVHTEMVPYSKFKRGEMQWQTVQFEEPLDVPAKFSVILQFNAAQTKGVYVSYDSSSGGKYSKTGVAGGETNPVTFGGDWMIQAILTKPE